MTGENLTYLSLKLRVIGKYYVACTQLIIKLYHFVVKPPLESLLLHSQRSSEIFSYVGVQFLWTVISWLILQFKNYLSHLVTMFFLLLCY